MLPNSFIYGLKIWLTSVATAPVIYLAVEACTAHAGEDFTDLINQGFQFYGLCLFFGALFSLPTFIIFSIIIQGVTYYCTSIRHIKFVMAGIGVVLTSGTFAIFVFPNNKDSEAILLMISNAVCIAAGALFYKLDVGKSFKMAEG